MVKENMGPQKVLILVNGSQADDNVTKLACDMTHKTKGEIYAIYVIELKRTLPLEAEVEPEIQRGEEVLDHVEHLAESHGCEIETVLLQARDKGPAVMEEAIERNVDLIIIGMNYEKPFGEFSMGTTLPHILKKAPCRVIVCREPISKENQEPPEAPL